MNLLSYIITRGDNVKKRIIIYGLTICLAIIFAFFFYNNIDESLSSVTDNSNMVTVFQLGVFKSQTNAFNLIDKLKIGAVFYDEPYYRVYGAITVNNIELLEEYFTNLNINYYMKKVKVNNKFYQTVVEFDKLNTSLKVINDSTNYLLEEYKSSL